ncbi:putative ABC-2 type transporter [Helianthus annuus]|nr:putative ABC-2 type transporter [Helianthus annuus]KAJ0842430.1 putative ABC-2 type transporter [Helianthus annuus]KAJ0856071.1 putative ABC-2 type transporter [Helianthus annuus]
MVVKVLQRIAQTGSIVIMTNRTEFALDLIRELEGSPGGTKSLVEFNKSWRILKRSRRSCTGNETPTHGLSLKEAISASISRGKLVFGATTDISTTSLVPSFANPMWKEMLVLSKHSFRNSWRMPELFITRLGAVMVIGFILATMFWKLDDSHRGVRERLGFFAFAMSTTFYTCADALPVFIEERFIFMRETAYNAYMHSSYVLSRSLVAIPTLVFVSITFAIITFWAVGLDGGAFGFFFYFFIILCSFWAGSSFVTFLSAVVPHVMIGYVIVVAILAYFLLFSGFFINRDRIPDYWIWFHRLHKLKIYKLKD